MDTNCLKQLRLLELALLHGSGSRKAAGAVMWFSETTHIALAGLREGGAPRDGLKLSLRGTGFFHGKTV